MCNRSPLPVIIIFQRATPERVYRRKAGSLCWPLNRSAQPINWGALIRQERIRRNLTQQELANLTGTGQKTTSRIENGNEGATLATVFKLLAVL